MDIVMGVRGDLIVPKDLFVGSGLGPGTRFTVVRAGEALTLVPADTEPEASEEVRAPPMVTAKAPEAPQVHANTLPAVEAWLAS